MIKHSALSTQHSALTFVSLLAENMRPTYRAIAGYLSEHADMPVSLVEDRPWQAQEHMLDAGEADAGFLCGLLYTQKTAQLELLAAPVMRATRYNDRPIYFSDVIVRRDSRYHSFTDLRGADWAFNDPGSFSGYALPRAHLAALGETERYFTRWVESGGHLRSIAAVVAGTADAAAIDSTVLDFELAQRPELVAQLRVVERIGPSPIPPLAIGRHVPAALKSRLRDALLAMDQDVTGQAILAAGMIARFVTVDDAAYDDIRRKAAVAAALA